MKYTTYNMSTNKSTADTSVVTAHNLPYLVTKVQISLYYMNNHIRKHS